MKHFKKKFAFVLTLVFVLSILMTFPIAAGEVLPLPSIKVIKPGVLVNDDLIENMGKSLQLPKIAAEAIKRGVKPGVFNHINYTLKQNVELLSDETVLSIKSNTKGGVVEVSGLGEFKPEESKTYVDKSSGLAFKLVKGTDDKTYMFAAEQDSVVEDFEIPDQTVFLNEANITSVNDAVQLTALSTYSTGDAGSELYQVKFDEKIKVPGFDQDGVKVEVKLKGSININRPSVDAEYTKNNGYKFIFNAGESAEVSAELYAEVKKEVKVPLLGFDIPSDICSVSVGVFFVISADGKVTLEYSFNQHYDVKAGFKGDTWNYIPTGIDGVKENDFGFDTEGVKISAKIKGEAYISAQVTFKILGKVEIKIDVKLGLLLEVKGEYGGNPDMLTIKADGVFSINGRLKIKSIDKKKELFSYRFPLFKKTQEPEPDYVISITEACAYRDIIEGRVDKRAGADSLEPYKDKPVKIKITGNNSSKTIDLNTDSEGKFKAAYNLVNGTAISVKIPESSDLWTVPVKAAFPFINIVIDKADYYDNSVKGYISKDETGAVSYTGPVMIGVLRRENVTITSTEDITVPINNMSYKQIVSAEGDFRGSIDDLNPYDMVYAYIDYDGFKVYGEWKETEGFDFFVNSNYIQQPERLSSLGGTIVLGGSYVKAKPVEDKTNKLGTTGKLGTTDKLMPGSIIIPGIIEGLNKIEPSGEIKYKVEVIYPHGQNPDKTQEKEWILPLSKTQEGIVTAVIGPWEMNLLDMQALNYKPPVGLESYINILSGDSSIRYHVHETIEYFHEGKRIEISNEALTCDCERAQEGMKLPEIPLYRNEYTPLDDKPVIASPILLDQTGRIDSVLPEIITGVQGNSTMYKSNTGSTTDSNAAASQGPENFSCKVLVKKYEGPKDINPKLSNWNLSVYNDWLKITSYDTSILLFRDLRQKVLLNNEFNTATPVRYDGEDFIYAFKGLGFKLAGGQLVNKVVCDVYQKSSTGADLKIYEWRGKGVPMKILFDNNDSRTELMFSDHIFNQVTGQDMEY